MIFFVDWNVFLILGKRKKSTSYPNDSYFVDRNVFLILGKRKKSTSYPNDFFFRLKYLFNFRKKEEEYLISKWFFIRLKCLFNFRKKEEEYLISKGVNLNAGGSGEAGKSPQLPIHELRGETYNGLVRLLKPGCRTIVLLCDSHTKPKLITKFYKSCWPYRKWDFAKSYSISSFFNLMKT